MTPKSKFSPISILCGVLLFMLLGLFSVVASSIVPFLLELLEEEPRLAMIGFLGLVTSPAFVVVLVHHIGHRALDSADKSAGKARGILPKTISWWAGAHAWMVLYGTSVLTSLVMLVINPPERDESHSMAVSVLASLKPYVVTTFSNALSLHALVWIIIATMFFELERRARAKD